MTPTGYRRCEEHTCWQPANPDRYVGKCLHSGAVKTAGTRACSTPGPKRDGSSGRSCKPEIIQEARSL